jgi:hypothetical protein
MESVRVACGLHLKEIFVDRRVLCILIFAFATLSIVACDDTKTMEEHAKEAQAKNTQPANFTDTARNGTAATHGTINTATPATDNATCDVQKAATQDDLAALAVSRANALSPKMKAASTELAEQVRDANVTIDGSGAHMVKVQVVYDFQMAKSTIDLRGQMDNSANVKLVQAPKPGQQETFAGMLTCADNMCRNIFLRVDQLSGKKVAKSLFIVQRWSEAHVVMSQQDRKTFAKMPNQNESGFAEYVANSLNNICLDNLKAVSAPKSGVPACIAQNLKAECGSEDMRQPAAKAVGLRTWEVAGGRGGFELQFLDSGIYNPLNETSSKPFLSVRGPLISASVSTPSPQWKHPLVFTGNAKGIDAVNLVTSETSVSDLSLQFSFTGSPSAQLQMTVLSILPSTSRATAILQTAQAMPVLQQQDLVSDNENVEGTDLN